MSFFVLPGVRRPLRRGLRLVLAALPPAGLALAAWVGWFSPVRPWPAATGWQRLPAELRPDDGPLWDAAAAGEEPPVLGWLGHAGFVLDWHGVRLLLDPNTSRRCTIAPRLLEPAVDVAGLGPVDAVLVSHAHYDHLDLPTLLAVRELGTVVLPRGSEVFLPPALRQRARPLAVGESLAIGELSVTAVAAAHNGNRFHPLASRQAAVGWIVRSRRNALYFAGDTGFGNDFAAIREGFHPRVAILPIGAYSPRLVLAPYHLSPEEAVAAAEVLGVETVVPAHFGTFVLFFDRPADALPRFARAAHERRLPWRMPQLLTSS